MQNDNDDGDDMLAYRLVDGAWCQHASTTDRQTDSFIDVPSHALLSLTRLIGTTIIKES